MKPKEEKTSDGVFERMVRKLIKRYQPPAQPADNPHTSVEKKKENAPIVVAYDKRVMPLKLSQLPPEWEEKRWKAAVEFMKEQDIYIDNKKTFLSSCARDAIFKAEVLIQAYLLMARSEQGAGSRESSGQSGNSGNDITQP